MADGQREPACAWSSDEELGTSLFQSNSSPQRLASKPPKWKKLNPDIKLQCFDNPIPSLQSLCLRILGEHLQELLDCASDILPFLPSHIKAVFSSISRRRQLLDDRALGLLCDEDQYCLDCHGTCVTEGAIQRAIEAAPRLRFVDLTGCTVGPTTLRLLRHCCPRVEVLRIGSAGLTDNECAGAIKRMLPLLDKAQHADMDSWETLAASNEGADVAAPSGRLMRLRCLVWPRMPFQLQQYCRASCPQVAVNPSTEEVVRRGLPQEFNPAFALDDAILQDAGLLQAWEEGQGQAGAGPGIVHIAEKFRLAYVEQAQRLKEREQRAERRRQQQTRRELRQSPAQMAIRQWLDET